jgi:hypothetical protein
VVNLIVYFLTLCKIKVRTFNVESYVVYLQLFSERTWYSLWLAGTDKHYKDNFTVNVLLHFGDIITVHQLKIRSEYKWNYN